MAPVQVCGFSPAASFGKRAILFFPEKPGHVLTRAMILILIIGCLLILGISLMVLNDAVQHAGEGYEDSTGFHQKKPAWTANSIASREEEISIWDKVEGACCPLDISPALRRAGSHSLSPQRPWKTPNAS